MTKSTKRITLLFLTLTLFSIVLLSSSLSNLQLGAGVPFPVVDSHFTTESSVSQQNLSGFSVVLQIILKLILLLLMIYVPVRFILAVKLKWVLRLIQVLAILLIIVVALSFIQFEPGAELPAIAVPVPVGVELSAPDKPPEGFTYFVLISLSLVGALLIAKIFTPRVPRADADNPLLKEAETAMRALRAGRDFKDVIVCCYMDMVEALKNEYGIERSKHLTAREFEDLLEYRGLPAQPIRELTNLFEKVRYGRQQLSISDEKQAIESLNAIVRFARGTPHE